MNPVLEQFAISTGHDENDWETPSQINTLVQKYIALHCGSILPVHSFYPYIDSDYEALHAYDSRCLEELATKKQMDPNFFVWVMSHTALPSTREQSVETDGAFQEFQKSIFPNVQQQKATGKTNSDEWKHRAYFLALHCRNKPLFGELVKVVFDKDVQDTDSYEHKQAYYHLQSQLQTYELCPEHEDRHLLCQEIGRAIRSIDITDNMSFHDDGATTTANTTTTTTTTMLPHDKAVVANIISSTECNGGGGNTIASTYKRDANLSVLFSPEKALKQAFCLALYAPNSTEHDLAHLMPINQLELPAAWRGKTLDVQEWKDIMSGMRCFAAFAIHDSDRLGAIATVIDRQGKGFTKQQAAEFDILVRDISKNPDLVRERWPEWAHTPFDERACKHYIFLYPEMDRDAIKNVIY